MIEAEDYVNDEICRQEKIESYEQELADECMSNRDGHIVLEALKRIEELESQLDEAVELLRECRDLIVGYEIDDSFKDFEELLEKIDNQMEVEDE
jgi:hypothetical protein